MYKYLISNILFFVIIKAENETEAWAEYITEDQEEKFWSKEDVRLELLKIGYSSIKITKLENVFELI